MTTEVFGEQIKDLSVISKATAYYQQSQVKVATLHAGASC